MEVLDIFGDALLTSISIAIPFGIYYLIEHFVFGGNTNYDWRAFGVMIVLSVILSRYVWKTAVKKSKPTVTPSS